MLGLETINPSGPRSSSLVLGTSICYMLSVHRLDSENEQRGQASLWTKIRRAFLAPVGKGKTLVSGSKLFWKPPEDCKTLGTRVTGYSVSHKARSIQAQTNKMPKHFLTTAPNQDFLRFQVYYDTITFVLILRI